MPPSGSPSAASKPADTRMRSGQKVRKGRWATGALHAAERVALRGVVASRHEDEVRAEGAANGLHDRRKGGEVVGVAQALFKHAGEKKREMDG